MGCHYTPACPEKQRRQIPGAKGAQGGERAGSGALGSFLPSLVVFSVHRKERKGVTLVKLSFE